MSKELLNIIAQSIYDKKGFNIIALDVKSISTLSDYIIIGEGNVDRHVRSIASHIMEEMEKKQIIPYRVEGKLGGDWIVIDYHDIIVHLFMPHVREKYQLERLWSEGKIIDLKINIEKSQERGFDYE